MPERTEDEDRDLAMRLCVGRILAKRSHGFFTTTDLREAFLHGARWALEWTEKEDAALTDERAMNFPDPP